MALKIKIDKRNNFIYVKRDDGMVMGKVFESNGDKILFDLTDELYNDFFDFLTPQRAVCDEEFEENETFEESDAYTRELIDHTKKWIKDELEKAADEAPKSLTNDEFNEIINKEVAALKSDKAKTMLLDMVHDFIKKQETKDLEGYVKSSEDFVFDAESNSKLLQEQKEIDIDNEISDLLQTHYPRKSHFGDW